MVPQQEGPQFTKTEIKKPHYMALVTRDNQILVKEIQKSFQELNQEEFLKQIRCNLLTI
jgi:hypothetical protein